MAKNWQETLEYWLNGNVTWVTGQNYNVVDTSLQAF